MIAWLALIGCTGAPSAPQSTVVVPLGTDTADTALAAPEPPREWVGYGIVARTGASLAWVPGDPPRIAVGYPGGDWEDAAPAGVTLVSTQAESGPLHGPSVISRWLDTSWTFHELDAQLGSQSLVPGDLTGNGADDLVVFGVTDGLGAGAFLLEGPLEGSGARTTLGAGLPIEGVPYRGAPCGDLDGDGGDDLFTAAGVALSPHHVPIDRWDLSWSRIGEPRDIRVATGDLDGDGALELLVSDPETALVHRLAEVVPGDHHLGDVSASAWSAPIAPRHLDAGADLDGDGLGDLVVAWHGEVPTVAVATALDGDLTGAWFRVPAKASAVATGDFDGDRFDDLAIGVSSELTGRVYVFAGPLPAGELRPEDADNVLSGHASSAGTFGAALVAGDADGDGDDELAVGDPGDQLDMLSFGRVTLFPDPLTFSWDAFDPPLLPIQQGVWR